MADQSHDDLGFVPNDAHADIGFVPKAKRGVMDTVGDIADYATNINPMVALSKNLARQAFADPAASQAGLEHAGNAASLGYLPQLQAKAEPYTTAIGNALTGQDVEVPSYVQRRDENIARSQQQEKDSPYASMGGTVAGGLVSGIATSALTPIKAATFAGRAAQAARAGALVGAAANPGDVTGEVAPFQLGERATGAAIGGSVGAPLQMLGEGAGKVLGYGADKLGGLAERMAFKSMGPYQRDVILNSGRMEDVGRTLLDTGVVGVPTNYEGLAQRALTKKGMAGADVERIINELSSHPDAAGMSRSEIADAVKAALIQGDGVPGSAANNKSVNRLVGEFSEHGRMPQELPLSADDAHLENLKLNYGKPDTQTFYPQDPHAVTGELPAPFPQNPEGMNRGRQTQVRQDIDRANLAAMNDPGVSPYADAIEVSMGTIGKKGIVPNDDLSLKEAWNLKKQVGDTVNWRRLPDADVPITEQVNRKLYSELRQGEDAIADQLAQSGQAEGGAFQEAKNRYGHLMESYQMAKKRSEKEFANRFLGLTDTISGGAGAGVGAYIGGEAGGSEGAKAGALAGGAIGAGGNKLMRTYGTQVIAHGADSFSKFLQETPQLARMIQNNPTMGPILQKMLSGQGQQGQEGRQKHIPEDEARKQFLKGN